MKKVLSLILVAVMLVSVFTISAYAEPEYDVSDCKYFDKIVELNYRKEPWYYDELYYHYSDENSEEPDWALVYAYTDDDMYNKKHGVVVNNMVLWTVGSGDLSISRYLVYVTSLDEFLRVDGRDLEQIIEHCPDFVEIIEEKEFGQHIGDVNDDLKINILDVTYIQRLLAEHIDYVYARYDLALGHRSNDLRVGFVDEVQTYENGKWNSSYISDFNRDGERTILDATAIQMKLAKVEDTVVE